MHSTNTNQYKMYSKWLPRLMLENAGMCSLNGLLSNGQGSWPPPPSSIYHLQNKQPRRSVLTWCGSQHDAGTTRDQHSTAVRRNSGLGEVCLLRMRQMPHGINTGTLAGCQMSQSQINRPEVGLLNTDWRAKVRTPHTLFTKFYVVYSPLGISTLLKKSTPVL